MTYSCHIKCIIIKSEMMIENELIKNSGRLHTTEMGINRIKKNLALDCDDVVEWCKNQIKIAGADCDKNISRKGKNWYVDIGCGIITVNAYSYTIITAHKKKNAATGF